MSIHSTYDTIVVGAGVSGSFMAQALVEAGQKVLILEAGKSFTRTTYPRKEIDANSQLYWGGGVELNTSATLALLRPKVVGGGSVVNQALMDRFDEDAFSSWRDKSGVKFFDSDFFETFYELAESEIAIEIVPEHFRNGNAAIFEEGFKKNGYKCAPLIRAQRDCHFEDGNDCIECLAGCSIDSKQSMPVTALRRALQAGAHLISEFQVETLKTSTDLQMVGGMWKNQEFKFQAKKVVLAAGAIGNSCLLLKNNFDKKLPAVGKNFFTHPQFMVLGIYKHEVNAHKGPLQSYKSYDPNFRKQGFKLENVFAPPVAISMLLPQVGADHAELMKSITKMGCIEVAIRDTHPGSISLAKNGRPVIHKELNSEDLKRKAAGMEAIQNIMHSTGAERIIPGQFGIGLHLMGGCSIGQDGKTSVVNEEFQLHDHPHVYVADSSVFPDAPGINPSLTIMAMSKFAAYKIIRSRV